MKNFIPSLRFGLLLAVALALTGCVNAKYKTTNKDTPPAASLNLTNEQAPVSVTVHSVIVLHGPGSWKRNAYWDEYVVSVANRGVAPVTLESATLVDFTGTPSAPSDNPWLLEKQSRTREAELKATVKNVLIQVGGGYVGASVAITGAVAAGGMLGGMIALPAYVAGTIYANVHSRHQIEDEFTRRRLVLPAILAPGQTVQGSLFFRISPGPRNLALLQQNDGAYQKVVIDLSPLAGLHLAKPASPAR